METNFSSGDAPPPLAPPVIAPQPIKPRKSWGWMIFAIILLVLLSFSLLGNFVSYALSFNNGHKGGTARQVGPRLDEVTLEDNDSSSKIAVITVDGIITSHTTDQAGNNMVDVIQAQLDRAKEDSHVKAVIL